MTTAYDPAARFELEVSEVEFRHVRLTDAPRRRHGHVRPA
jgi:hypothetical protein